MHGQASLKAEYMYYSFAILSKQQPLFSSTHWLSVKLWLFLFTGPLAWLVVFSWYIDLCHLSSLCNSASYFSCELGYPSFWVPGIIHFMDCVFEFTFISCNIVVCRERIFWLWLLLATTFLHRIVAIILSCIELEWQTTRSMTIFSLSSSSSSSSSSSCEDYFLSLHVPYVPPIMCRHFIFELWYTSHVQREWINELDTVEENSFHG